jgi:MYXO-CTERM domain-containing protein
MMTPYGTLDAFVFISLPGSSVPAPGAIALLGAAGLMGRRRSMSR